MFITPMLGGVPTAIVSVANCVSYTQPKSWITYHGTHYIEIESRESHWSRYINRFEQNRMNRIARMFGWEFWTRGHIAGLTKRTIPKDYSWRRFI